MRFPALTPRRLAVLAATAACAAALIPVAATAATASPAAAASAARTSASAAGALAVSVNSMTLVANGAALRGAFTATCDAGEKGSVGSTTTQAAGDRVAQGAHSSAGFICTGKPQQVTDLITVDLRGAPFHAGVALVHASVAFCPGDGANCVDATTDKVMSIGG